MENSNSNKLLYKRLMIRLILFIILGLVIYFSVPLLFKYTLPFTLALIVTALINPIVNWLNTWLMSKKIDSITSRKWITLVVTFLIILFLGFFVYYIMVALIREIMGIATSIQDNWPTIVMTFEDLQDYLMTFQLDDLPPEIIELGNNLINSILEFIRTFSGQLLNITVTTTGSLISMFGTFGINFITFFMALYFILSEFNYIEGFFNKSKNNQFFHAFTLIKDSLILGVGGYIRTQFIYAALVFIVIFFSFSFYGMDYALTFAFILALVDVLPILGANGVLFPWGIAHIVFGNFKTGIFLLLIGGFLFIVRRVTEPKVMGTQTGLHPLLSLFSIYVGLQISGIWGALLGPLVMIIILALIRSNLFKNTFEDIKELSLELNKTLRREN